MRKTTITFFLFLCLRASLFAASASSEIISESTQLNSIKQSIEAIKKDDSNNSYTFMLDQVVMQQHSLANHGKKTPYFYTNNRLLISDIISMVVEKPQGIITTQITDGKMGIYR